MSLDRLEDMIILLPGIMGSVLEKDGKDLWAISGQACWNIFSSMGAALDDLLLKDDDPNHDDLEDGIRATRLIPDLHLVPGLAKIDGYTAIVRLIKDNFNIRLGFLDRPEPANFFEFPYDWRRDNRVAARKLKQLIERQLPKWRQLCKDAKVILIAHSMGGLVARYYLEVLEGWRECKALITFGTPYRGSLNALNFMANGYKKLFLDLTTVMRSFTSLYQLLPIYPVIRDAGKYSRVSEIDGIPGIERERAEQALKFHREIEAAVTAHQEEIDYLKHGYKILPFVGTHQPTLQSADFSGGRLLANREVPAGVDKLLVDGDGTVPRLSAIPLELSEEYRDTFVPERHGSLQCNKAVLLDLLGRIQQMQVIGLGEIRGPMIIPLAEQGTAISLDLDDLYIEGEPVEIFARLANAEKQDAYGPFEALIQRVGSEVWQTTHKFQEDENGWRLTVEGLLPGAYRMEVRTASGGPGSPPSVHDVFEIAG
jgi:pimeloyl-ACP methyl ester carboxylesterase